MRVGSIDIVAMHRARPRRHDRRGIEMADAERGEIADQAPRIGEGEAAMKLQAHRRARHAHRCPRACQRREPPSDVGRIEQVWPRRPDSAGASSDVRRSCPEDWAARPAQAHLPAAAARGREGVCAINRHGRVGDARRLRPAPAHRRRPPWPGETLATSICRSCVAVARSSSASSTRPQLAARVDIVATPPAGHRRQIVRRGHRRRVC